MPKYRLGPRHPLTRKFEALLDAADKLGIRINFHGSTNIEIHDTETDFSVWLEDLENDSNLTSFPPEVDYKLIFEME